MLQRNFDCIGETEQGKIEYDVEAGNGLSLDSILELAFILSPYPSTYRVEQ